MWNNKKERLGKKIIKDLYIANMIQTWYRNNPNGWILQSGLWSPLYINLRDLPSYPKIFNNVINGLSYLIKNECAQITKLIGIAMAGIPIASALSYKTKIPMGYTRKFEGISSVDELQSQISKYGAHKLIEGQFKNGDNVLFVDDLVTTLSSKLIALKMFEEEMKKSNINVQYNSFLVIFDREQGGEEYAKSHDLKLYSLIKFKTDGLEWLKDMLAPIEYEVIKDYLNDHNKYQNKEIQEQLKSKCKFEYDRK